MFSRDRSSARGRGMSLGECQAALIAAREEADGLRDKYLRAEADIQNARRRAEREAAAQVARRLRSFCEQLIEVADNLERALAHAPVGDALRPGVEATHQQLLAALRQEGVVPIAVAAGDRFDPQIHEALGGHAADVPHETVAEVARPGYMFGDQVLRPAHVVVALPGQPGAR